MAWDTEERVHGGLDAREARAHGVDPASVLDLSVNINPHGPCEALVDAARAALLEKYPDPSAFAARLAWASVLDRSPGGDRRGRRSRGPVLDSHAGLW